MRVIDLTGHRYGRLVVEARVGSRSRYALRLNQRPRKTLGFETPADRLRAVLQ